MRTIWKFSTCATITLAAPGCSDLLDVTNPGAIPEERLTDPALELLMINGAIGEFQFAYGNYTLWSGVLSDEVFTDHTNVSVRDFSLHNFGDLNETNEGVYENLQRARASADDAVDRLKSLLGPAAASSLNVARALAYGGYAYVLLGEGFCDAPINLSAPKSSDELLTLAIAHFDEAIAVATAAKAGANAANTAAAQDLIYMSQVGAARAALKKGDATKARTYAALVPPAYEKLAYYSSNSVRENNQLNRPARTADPFLGIQPVFLNLKDPRMPQSATSRPGLNSNAIFPPQRPMNYSGWSPTTVQTIDITTLIKFATGLEAQYIMAETDGPTAATLVFVNARRAIGGQPSVDLTGAELMAELRAQRARDFFLTGQRLGDLRRYAKAGTDLFPTGKYPVFPDPYGTAKCFIVPLSEKAVNPNY
jgi:DNA uptake protein ComE-like DNA-binding protein